jgi:hypothetical protein
MKTNHLVRSTLAGLALTVALGLSTACADSTVIPTTYPLKTCIVSGEKLGEHGKVVKVTAPDGTDVYVCCRSCAKDFKKDPAKYAKMVQDAALKK